MGRDIGRWMRKFLIILCCILPLMACDQISGKVEQIVPIPTIEQDLTAEYLLEYIKQQDLNAINELAHENLKPKLQNETQKIQQLAALIPDEAYDKSYVLQYAKTNSTENGKLYTVIYVYKYSTAFITLKVVFDGAEEHSTQIKGFYLQKQEREPQVENQA